MASDDREAELRPVNSSTSSSESELSEEEKDEQFDKEFREKLERGTNRKSSDRVTQRSSLGHILSVYIRSFQAHSMLTMLQHLN